MGVTVGGAVGVTVRGTVGTTVGGAVGRRVGGTVGNITLPSPMRKPNVNMPALVS